jgi:hypothetical protein
VTYAENPVCYATIATQTTEPVCSSLPLTRLDFQHDLKKELQFWLGFLEHLH